jgi:hypothetical protein
MTLDYGAVGKLLLHVLLSHVTGLLNIFIHMYIDDLIQLAVVLKLGETKSD